jgi:hypothetical protein
MWNMLGGSARALDDELVRRAAALARRSARRDPLVDELLRAERPQTGWKPRTIAVAGHLDEWTLLLLAAVLTDEFWRQAPRLGELIAVRHDGRAQPQTVGRLCATYGLLGEHGATDVVDEAPF